jgi:ubiquinone/menaquinone biosynthesis C-methylase UbiE
MKSEAYPGAMAEEYEYLINFYPEHYRLREKVAELLGDHFKQQKALIIDIGCGTGETTEYILKQTKLKVIAIDNDEHMIKRLKEKFSNYIAEKRLIPICQDIFTYIKEIQTGSFDGVTSSWTIHNFTKKERFILLREIFRILKPNDIFVNMDKYVFDDPTEERKSLEEMIAKLRKIPNKSLSETAIQHEEDDRHPDIIMKELESVSEMKKIGFKDVKFHMRIRRETVMSCFK